jgi:hypothetical protein
MILRLVAAAGIAWLALADPGAAAGLPARSGRHFGASLWDPPAAAPQRNVPRANGQACRHDTDCDERNCRRHPDGERYCAASGRVCPLPGADGARAGKKLTTGGRCVECRLGQGWMPCG